MHFGNDKTLMLRSYVNLKILVWVFGTALLFTLYFLIRGKYKEKYLERKEKEFERKEREFERKERELEKRVSRIEKKKK